MTPNYQLNYPGDEDSRSLAVFSRPLTTYVSRGNVCRREIVVCLRLEPPALEAAARDRNFTDHKSQGQTQRTDGPKRLDLDSYRDATGSRQRRAAERRNPAPRAAA
jgi:hypothetical protein